MPLVNPPVPGLDDTVRCGLLRCWFSCPCVIRVLLAARERAAPLYDCLSSADKYRLSIGLFLRCDDTTGFLSATSLF